MNDRYNRKPAIVTIVIGLVFTCVAAKPSSAQMTPAYPGWYSELDRAKQVANDSNRDLFIFFADRLDSDASTRIHEAIFTAPEFQFVARRDFVLVVMTAEPEETEGEGEEQRQQREAEFATAREAYQIRGYPTLVLADSTGRPISRIVGYHGESADEVAEFMHDSKAKRHERDRLMQLAESARGLHRAQLLHDSLNQVDETWHLPHYREEMEEIVTIDRANVAGLRVPLELRLIRFDADVDNLTDSIQKLDTFAQNLQLENSLLQEIYFTKAALLYEIDRECSYDTFLQAHELDTESKMARQIEDVLDRAFPEHANPP